MYDHRLFFLYVYHGLLLLTDPRRAKGEQAIAYYEETLRRRHQASENEKAQNDRKDIRKVER